MDQGHSVSLGTQQDGPLGKEFVNIGVQQFNPSMAKAYDLYIANTFLTVPLALHLAPSADKIVAWIHESRSFFTLYGKDETQYGLSHLRRAVFPSKFQINEYRDLMPDCELHQLRNVVSMTGIERSNTYSDHFSVSGTWEVRKNQVGLLKLIGDTDLNIKLNFVGASKPDDLDSTKHNYFGQVPLAEAKSIIASSCGLISAALNETQNLAAIEAILVANPVLLSNIPAHQELKELIPDITLFDTADAASFADGFDRAMRQKQNLKSLEEGRKSAEIYFGNSAFSEAVRSLTT